MTAGLQGRKGLASADTDSTPTCGRYFFGEAEDAPRTRKRQRSLAWRRDDIRMERELPSEHRSGNSTHKGLCRVSGLPIASSPPRSQALSLAGTAATSPLSHLGDGRPIISRKRKTTWPVDVPDERHAREMERTDAGTDARFEPIREPRRFCYPIPCPVSPTRSSWRRNHAIREISSDIRAEDASSVSLHSCE